MKTYPLALDLSFDIESGELFAVFSRGHHETGPFLEAAKSYLHDEGYLDGWPNRCAETLVARTYYRIIPLPTNADFHFFYRNQSHPGRGAFPVTVLELDL